jgi:membrane protein DedA with SNARE-associated domain
MREAAGWLRTDSATGEHPLSGNLEQSILDFVRQIYNSIGWPGVVLLMAAESAGIPIPSEIIMPFAGWFLIQDRHHGFGFVLLAGLLGALGNTIGSIVAYYIGAWGGRPLLERYGRYVLISHHDLDRADRFFARRGELAVFVSRLLPVVRTFISFPAGISRMRIGVFIVLTFAGSFLWSVLLTWAGYELGKDWEQIRAAMRPFDYPIAALIALAIAWFIWRHVRRAREPYPGPEASDAGQGTRQG